MSTDPTLAALLARDHNHDLRLAAARERFAALAVRCRRSRLAAATASLRTLIRRTHLGPASTAPCPSCAS